MAEQVYYMLNKLFICNLLSICLWIICLYHFVFMYHVIMWELKPEVFVITGIYHHTVFQLCTKSYLSSIMYIL